MKNLMTKSFLLLLFLVSSYFFGQFNTLMPSQPKKSQEVHEEATSKSKTENTVEKKERKQWKKILKITTKSDLKNEIDSLKSLIKDFSLENKKDDLKNIKDSLLLSTKSALQKKQISKKGNENKVFDFVEEPDDTVSKIVMPLKNKISITSSYGTRTHPIFGTKKMHNGVDLKAHYENVYSVMDGIVTAAGWDPKGGGNYIKVKHYNRFETIYMHLSEFYYNTGERVKAGFIIGKSGNTGNSTGPHLHFSVKEFGQSINPANFLNDLIKVNNLIAIYNE